MLNGDEDLLVLADELVDDVDELDEDDDEYFWPWEIGFSCWLNLLLWDCVLKLCNCREKLFWFRCSSFWVIDWEWLSLSLKNWFCEVIFGVSFESVLLDDPDEVDELEHVDDEDELLHDGIVTIDCSFSDFGVFISFFLFSIDRSPFNLLSLRIIFWEDLSWQFFLIFQSIFVFD